MPRNRNYLGPSHISILVEGPTVSRDEMQRTHACFPCSFLAQCSSESSNPFAFLEDPGKPDAVVDPASAV